MKIIPVILCGGIGKRLSSTIGKDIPKQFVALFNKLSLLQNTVLRTQRILKNDSKYFVFVTSAKYKKTIKTQLDALNENFGHHVLYESTPKNTALSVAMAAVYIERIFGPKTLIWVLPIDHCIKDEGALAQSLDDAILAAKNGYLATFGIIPDRPETGYGYIQFAKEIVPQKMVYNVKKFTEKPDLKTAQTYCENGNFFWNSGMYLFDTKTIIENYKNHAPKIFDFINKNPILNQSVIDSDALDPISFDVAISEKADKVAVVPCDMGWSDVGAPTTLNKTPMTTI